MLHRPEWCRHERTFHVQDWLKREIVATVGARPVRESSGRDAVVEDDRVHVGILTHHSDYCTFRT
jgi:hypothetical protein